MLKALKGGDQLNASGRFLVFKTVGEKVGRVAVPPVKIKANIPHPPRKQAVSPGMVQVPRVLVEEKIQNDGNDLGERKTPEETSGIRGRQGTPIRLA